jgi:hypothetical protein
MVMIDSIEWGFKRAMSAMDIEVTDHILYCGSGHEIHFYKECHDDLVNFGLHPKSYLSYQKKMEHFTSQIQSLFEETLNYYDQPKHFTNRNSGQVMKPWFTRSMIPPQKKLNL